jgi:uncharacterized protein (TIGR01319 family)
LAIRVPDTFLAIEPSARDRPPRQPVVLADFGSTYTKVVIVDASDGSLAARGWTLTSIETDVMDGLAAVLETLEEELRPVSLDYVLACSSAAGGLRLGVVGLEEDLTAEAGRKAALSAGARVVTVVSGGLSGERVTALLAGQPDIILLTGGTDGGNSSCLLESARVLSATDLSTPVVVAGNLDAQAEALEILRASGHRAVATPNVMPDIGRINEEPVRTEIRELFVHHVIGGKRLSRGETFRSLVRMPTPEAVLRATELVARGHGKVRGRGDLAVVDIGGATTDVHSVVDTRGSVDRGYARSVLPDLPSSRTVEGDLGLRWNAAGIADAAEGGRLLGPEELRELRRAAEIRAADPSFIPDDDPQTHEDVLLASIAAVIALQRHAGELRISLSPDGATLRRTGKDLRSVATLIGTGGIFAHAPQDSLSEVLRPSVWAAAGRRLLLPDRPRILVDRDYVMAAAGLLASEHPDAAAALLDQHLVLVASATQEENS